MHTLKNSLATVAFAAIALFTMTLVGCTANSITGAQMENPAAVESAPQGPSGSSAGTSYDYNGADVEGESYDTEESGEGEKPKLSTDPNSHYNI